MRRQAAKSADRVSGKKRCMWHQTVEGLGRRQHTRHTCAWMCAGGDEIEAIDVFGLVMRPEPGALGEQRLEAEGGALEGKKAVAEMLWRHCPRRDDVRLEPGEQGVVQMLRDRLAIR